MINSRSSFEELGFVIFPELLSSPCVDQLIDKLSPLLRPQGRAGQRHALKLDPVSALARSGPMMKLSKELLGPAAFPFRATLFDKSPRSNWLVVWHQDTALPLQNRMEVQGWGPWSVKAGINYAHAPAKALEGVVALRVTLDDSTLENGPLRVLPGTHTLGVLTDDEIHHLSQNTAPVDCTVSKGGVLAMRPLLVHSSSKVKNDLRRRVLHIEYAASKSIAEPLELAVA